MNGENKIPCPRLPGGRQLPLSVHVPPRQSICCVEAGLIAMMLDLSPHVVSGETLLNEDEHGLVDPLMPLAPAFSLSHIEVAGSPCHRGRDIRVLFRINSSVCQDPTCQYTIKSRHTNTFE